MLLIFLKNIQKLLKYLAIYCIIKSNNIQGDISMIPCKKVSILFVLLLALSVKCFSLDTEEITKLVENSIVYINVVSANGDSVSGSGFFVSDDGLIATCAHVLDTINKGKSQKYFVNIRGSLGTQTAYVQYKDDESDIAFLRLDIDVTSPYLTLAAEHENIGSPVLIYGFPIGKVLMCITQAIVSSTYLDNFIYLLDKAVPRDNSGGPVINKYGEAIGLISFKINPLEGQSFAINTSMFPYEIKSHILKNGYYQKKLDEDRSSELEDFKIENKTLVKYRENYKNVVIPDVVTSIGDQAFEWRSNLTSITIPNGVTSVGKCAFGDCTNLKEITIPNGVKSIGLAAFRNCSSLTSITIPNSIISMGDYAFYGCTSLNEITVPVSVKNIGKSAFEGCPKLTIKTPINSTAYKYAKKNKIKVKAL